MWAAWESPRPAVRLWKVLLVSTLVAAVGGVRPPSSGRFRGQGGGAKGAKLLQTRSLKRTGIEKAATTVVRTAEEFRAALLRGAPHIELQSHIDLSHLPLAAGNRILGIIPNSVKSIRVLFSLCCPCNTAGRYSFIQVDADSTSAVWSTSALFEVALYTCVATKQHAAMQGNCGFKAPALIRPSLSISDAPPSEQGPHKPGQCIILANYNLWEIFNTRLLLHNLDIHAAAPLRTSFQQLMLVSGRDAQVWMLNVSLQGAGDGLQHCTDCGITVRDRAQVFAKGAATILSMSRVALCCLTAVCC